MKLIFATQNTNKLLEIQDILGDKIELLSLQDMSFNQEIPEIFDTLEENSKIKAETIFEQFGIPCFADDTGLEVEALNGQPGVHSARFAGEHRNSEKNMNLLLEKMKGIDNRKARFRTVISYINSDGMHQFEGVSNGQILHNKRGAEGFGYDPIFLPDASNKTFAEMSRSEKNKFSHRARAFEKFRLFIAG